MEEYGIYCYEALVKVLEINGGELTLQGRKL